MLYRTDLVKQTTPSLYITRLTFLLIIYAAKVLNFLDIIDKYAIKKTLICCQEP